MTAHPSQPRSTAPRTQRLPNGLTVVLERSSSSCVAALELLLPVGAIHDPPDLPGATALTWAWIDRGAGGLSARERQDALARLGVRNGGAAGRERSGLSARMAADVLPGALRLIADEVAAPNLDAAQWELARTHALHDVEARDERPDARLDLALAVATFQPPYDRDPMGTDDGLRTARPEPVREHARRRLRPDRALLVITGGIDPHATLDGVHDAFGAWEAWEDPNEEGAPDPFGPPADAAASVLRPGAPHRRYLADPDLQQVQLGWSWPLLAAHDPRSAAQGLGIAALSEGSGSRLFARIRERYGLAYEVHARAVALPGVAWAEAYAATTPDRAADTVHRVEEELRRLADGVDDGELERARTQSRTHDAIQAETAGGRAAQIVRDLLLLGRVRTVFERDHDLRQPDLEQVNEALRAAPCTQPAFVALGGAAATFGGVGATGAATGSRDGSKVAM
ncbi:MAG: pitrilysin family protein [Trueperaceae bacterium]